MGFARLLAAAVLAMATGNAAGDGLIRPPASMSPPPQPSPSEPDYTGPDQYRPVVLGRVIIRIPSAWRHEVKQGPNDVLIADISRPGSTAYIKIMLRNSDRPVSPRLLRAMTNVDPSIALDWHPWGDFAGYQYDHTHAGSRYRQWWLTHENMLLFIVYGNATLSEADSRLIDGIARSISVGGNI